MPERGSTKKKWEASWDWKKLDFILNLQKYIEILHPINHDSLQMVTGNKALMKSELI